MIYRYSRVVFGALAMLFGVAPGSAAGITPGPRAGVIIEPQERRPAARRGSFRYLQLTGLGKNVAASGPLGCTSNGPNSFVGETGGGTNWAGGASAPSGFAGVIAGSYNESCDLFSLIGSGNVNFVGGDGLAQGAVIVGGLKNGIEAASLSFIGGGSWNLLGVAAPYNGEDHSGIVAGSLNTIASPYSFIGAGSNNVIVGASVANNYAGQSAFIGAGYMNAVTGNFAGIMSGQSNSVTADNSSVGGGQSNSVGGQWATIVGGQSNSVPASGQWASVVGGLNNNAGSFYSFIGGGARNAIPGGQPNGGSYSVIAGGYGNSIPPKGPASGEYAVIGGGYGNKITGAWAAIGGGDQNTATARSATIGGGNSNVAGGTNSVIAGGERNATSGTNAVVPGGIANVAAGGDSFAAGTASNAANTGTFVWSDAATGATTLSSTAANQFLARSSGGFFLYSSPNLSTGVTVAPGSGSWSNVSDRAAKTAIVRIDDAQVLAKVASLPVSEWSYTAQGTGVRHLGPMAQDFRAAFGLGEDARHIAVVDEEGVALASIKALQSELMDKNRQLDEMRRMDDNSRHADNARFARFERRLYALEAIVARTKSASRLVVGVR